MNTLQLTDQELQLLMDLHEYINDEDFMQLNESNEDAVRDCNTWESMHKKVEELISK
jgi:hypothetical protein